MKNKFSRREFIKKAAVISGAGFILPSFFPLFSQAENKTSAKNIIAVCKGKDPVSLTKGVLNILGGMKKFVKKGDVVLIKPNMSWERKPDLAATTNPDVVATLAKESLSAGAVKVKVLDRTCMDARRCYRTSGIQEAAKKAGAEVIIIEKHPSFYHEVTISNGKILKSWKIVKAALECNVLINVPIAKHHRLTKLTLGIKNLMGLLGDKRYSLHKNIDQKLVDILSVIKPTLNIMDAYRVLVNNGPSGGDEKDVRFTGKIIAGTDIVAVDSYTAELKVFGKLKGENINYIKAAADRKLGEMDLRKNKIIEKNI